MSFDPITLAMSKPKEIDLMVYSGTFNGATMSVGQAILLALSQGGGDGVIYEGNLSNLIEQLHADGEKVFLIDTGYELYHIYPTCVFEKIAEDEKGYGFNYIANVGGTLLKSFIYFTVGTGVNVAFSVTLY